MFCIVYMYKCIDAFTGIIFLVFGVNYLTAETSSLKNLFVIEITVIP